MTTLYVGVDMAKATFTVAYWHNGAGQAVGEFANNEIGFQECAQMLERHARTLKTDQVLVVVEPTAGYELPFASFVHQRGWRVSMPNPKHLHDWIKGTGQRAKTDPQDALRLAQYAAERTPSEWHPLSPAVSELGSLLQRQDDLAKMLQQERNRRDALAQRPNVSPRVIESVDSLLDHLTQALAEVTQALRKHLNQHPELKAQKRTLLQVPGIGSKNVLYILVLLHRWSTLTSGQGQSKGLVAFVGMDPQTHTSGTSIRRRGAISRMGSREMRRRMFMSALGGVRGHNVLRIFYERLVKRGKPKMVALMAAARKILVWAWAIFRQQSSFDEERILLKTHSAT